MNDIFIEGLFDGLEKVAGEAGAYAAGGSAAKALKSEMARLGRPLTTPEKKSLLKSLNFEQRAPSEITGHSLMAPHDQVQRALKPRMSLKDRAKEAIQKLKDMPTGKKALLAAGAAGAGYGGYRLYKHLKNKKKQKK